MPTTTEVHYRIVGRIWQGITCARASTVLSVGDGPFQVHIDPEDDDEIIGYLDMHEGDFMDPVYDVRVVTTHTTPNRYMRYDGSRVVNDYTVVRERVVRAFTEDEELAWSDCFAEDD